MEESNKIKKVPKLELVDSRLVENYIRLFVEDMIESKFLCAKSSQLQTDDIKKEISHRKRKC